MSASDTTIYRDYPIINGYVQVPHNLDQDKTRVNIADALAAIPGATLKFLSMGSGKCTGSKFGQQGFLRLPGLHPGESYATDPADLA